MSLSPDASPLADVAGVTLRHRFAEVRGGPLHIVDAGPAGGPPVLLLHGFPEGWHGWRKQIVPLALAGYRVLVPDQRGYGESSKPPGLTAYGVDALADDVAALLTEAGLESAHVVGHDWGGVVAWWVATRFPERVRSLAVLNGPHPLVMRKHMLVNPEQRKKSWYIYFFQLPWLPERYLAAHGMGRLRAALVKTARDGTFSAEEIADYQRSWQQPGALRGMLAWYRAAFRRMPARLASTRIRPRTLLIWGGRDRFLGQELIPPMLALCDDGRLELLPEATHWVQHEEPERVNELLLGHLARG